MRQIPDFMQDYRVVYISKEYGFAITTGTSNSLYMFKHGMLLADCCNQQTLDKRHKTYDDWYLAVRKKDLSRLATLQNQIEQLQSEINAINRIHYL